MSFIILAGDFSSGLHAHGLFDSFGQAQRYAKFERFGTHSILELTPPGAIRHKIVLAEWVCSKDEEERVGVLAEGLLSVVMMSSPSGEGRAIQVCGEEHHVAEILMEMFGDLEKAPTMKEMEA